MDQQDLALQIPAWGLFVIFVFKMVLDFIEKREAKKSASETPVPTKEEIAALVRDQDERKELLDSLRTLATAQAQTTSILQNVSTAQERIFATQQQLALRSRTLVEAMATSRQTVERMMVNVSAVVRDNEAILAALRARPVNTSEEVTPVQVPIPIR